MGYVFKKTPPTSFAHTLTKVREELSREGFGILTEIDVTEALKNKLGEDFRKYRILGACNPPYAYKALQLEPDVGAMLPCNVVVQENENGEVEVAAIDPIASMQAIENESLRSIAEKIQQKLKRVIDRV